MGYWEGEVLVGKGFEGKAPGGIFRSAEAADVPVQAPTTYESRSEGKREGKRKT